MKTHALLVSTATFVLVGVACGVDTSDPVLATPAPPTNETPSRPTPPGSSTSGSGSDDSNEPSDGPGWACPVELSVTEADLDKEVGWKGGAPAPGSCSETDLQTIAANLNGTSSKSFLDYATGVSETCKACVLSKDTDEKWGPVVATAENAGETGFLNYGACFGAIEGDACGKAIQYERFCLQIACENCADASERERCVKTVSSAGRMCASHFDARVAACPSYSLNIKSCGDIRSAIKTMCGTP